MHLNIQYIHMCDMNGSPTMSPRYFECWISGIHYSTAYWGTHNIPDILYREYRGFTLLWHSEATRHIPRYFISQISGNWSDLPQERVLQIPDIWHSKYRGIWLMAKFPDFCYTENRVFGHFNNSYIDSLALHHPHYTKDVCTISLPVTGK